MRTAGELPEPDVEKPLTRAGSGCFHASLVVAASAGLLFLNALLCLGVYAVLPKPGDENFRERLGQMYFFIVPVLLLVVEWNLFDRIKRLVGRGG